MRYILTALLFLLACLSFAQVQSIDSIPNEGIVLNKGWKFHPGDNAEWAKPHFDDGNWQAVNPTLDVSELPQLKQQPVGWLRIHFHVDSSLLNKPLAYHIFQSIASQVYINGVLADSFGVVSSDKNKIEEWRPSNDPEGIVFTQPEQTIAVRFSLRQSYWSIHLFTELKGFIFRISHIKQASHNSELSHQFPYESAIFFAFFFVIGLVTAVLYNYRPLQKAYLLFSIADFSASIAYLFSITIMNGDHSLFYIDYLQLVSFIISIMYIFTSYLAIRVLFHTKRNIAFWIITFMCLISFFHLFNVSPLLYYLLLVIVSGIESTRIIWAAYRKGNKNIIVLLTGYAVYWMGYIIFIAAYFILPYSSDTDFNLVDSLWAIINVSLPLFLVIYLSIDFANTSKELEKKLVEVKELSNEKQQILLSQNETLEQQVSLRTSQLNQSIHELKITQAQLVQSEKRQSQQILRLNEEVISRTEEVNNMKQTLASDFHDETGNMLSAITRQASLLKMHDGYNKKGAAVIDNIIANSNQLYASSRHFLWNLNNDSNDPHKLFEYLLSFGQGFYNSFGISFSAENELTTDFPGRLLPFAPLNLIFIFKEAINNVAKHAHATEVTLQVTQQNEFIVFSLVDNGNWKEPDVDTTHHGLHNMEKRCAQNKFRFAISHPGNVGTCIEVGAPFIVPS